MISPDGQLSDFVQGQNVAPPEEGPDTLRVTFRTALSDQINRAQEDAMVDQFFRRYDEVAREMGRPLSKQDNFWTSGMTWDEDRTPMQFLPRRKLFEMIYRQELGWRRWLLGGIFYLGQNLHLPYTFLTVQKMIARATNYFFASDPWFAVNPMPGAVTPPTPAPPVAPQIPGQPPQPAAPTGITAADQANDFAKYKFKQAHIKEAFTKGVEKTFIRGEQVIKTGHFTDAILYQSFSNVAIASPSTPKVPLMANDGDYLYDTDRWVLTAQPTAPQRQAIQRAADTAGQPPDFTVLPPGFQLEDWQQQMAIQQAANTGGEPDLTRIPSALTLERDPTTLYPTADSGALDQNGQLIFKKLRVKRRKIRYKGPVADPVNADDFLFPLTAPDLQKADFICHVYDIQALQLVQMFVDRLKATGELDKDEYPRVLEMLRIAPRYSGQATDTMATGPKPELRESFALVTENRGAPILNIGEGYMTMDVDGDGAMEEVFMIVDLKTRRPIIYDHLPNVFPDAKRPFHMFCINPVEGRCHGIGMVEIFSEMQRLIDLLANRIEFSTSQAGTVTFWQPLLTQEGLANKALKLNVGETYTKIDPKTPTEQILDRKVLYEFKADTLKPLLEQFQQLFTNLGGVATTNDADAAGLNPTKLATGINNIQQAGEEQFAPLIGHLTPGIESAVLALMYQLIANADDSEIYHVLQNGKQVPMQIQTIDIRNLEFSAEVELTRYRGQQSQAEAQGMITAAANFYANPLLLQERLLQLYKALGKGYQIGNVDAIFIPTDPSLYGPGGQVPGALPAGAPPPPPVSGGDQPGNPGP